MFTRAARSSCVQLVLVHVPLERRGLFDRVEVLALNVLDDRQLGHLPVGHFANLHRHAFPARHLGGAQAALAGDELVAALERPHDDRLQEAVRANAVAQVGDLGFVERRCAAGTDCGRSSTSGSHCCPSARARHVVAAVDDADVSAAAVRTAGAASSCSTPAPPTRRRLLASARSKLRPNSASSPRPNRRSLDTLQYLLAQFHVGAGAPRTRGVVDDRASVARRLGHGRIPWNHG